MGGVDADVSVALGMNESYARIRINKDPELKAYRDKIKSELDLKVIKSLHDRAVGFTKKCKEKITEDSATFGKTVTTKESDKYFPPETAAAKFWLTSRRPDQFKDQVLEEMKKFFDKKSDEEVREVARKYGVLEDEQPTN